MDTNDFSIVEIADFWQEKNSKKTLIEPLFVIANNRLSKFFGLGLSKDGSMALLFYEKPDIKQTYQVNEIIERTSIMCAEVSCNQNYIYIGGTKDNWAILGALRFN